MKIVPKIFAAFILFFLFFSGIIRHDVAESKYLELALEKQFDCAGMVLRDTSSGGSCTLISGKFALSAAHVFIESDSKADTINMNGKKVITYKSSNLRVMDPSRISLMFKSKLRSLTVKVKKITIHPHYLDPNTKGTCDMAILELDQVITEVTPAKINTNFDELHSDIMGVGYGASGPADEPAQVKVLKKKIAGENVIDSIGGQKYEGLNTIMMCDFDHPTRKDCNLMGSAVPKPLEYVTTGGDSGGSIFRKNNNQWELIGVCTGAGVNVERLLKTGYYGQTMAWTRTSVFSKWINENAK